MQRILVTKEQAKANYILNSNHHLSELPRELYVKVFPYPLYPDQFESSVGVRQIHRIKTWVHPSPFVDVNGDYLEYIIFKVNEEADEYYWIPMREFHLLDSFAKGNILQSWGYDDPLRDDKESLNTYTLWIEGNKKMRVKQLQDERV